MKERITHEDLTRLVHYNPATGFFTSLVNRSSRVRIGKIVGCKDICTGYWDIRINKVKYRGHILAWFYMTGKWPTLRVDHRDLNAANNAWSNLREATHAQNLQNSSIRPNNKSGKKGVYWSAKDKKFIANVTVNRKKIVLGYFRDLQEASDAYDVGAIKYHGEFALTNKMIQERGNANPRPQEDDRTGNANHDYLQPI